MSVPAFKASEEFFARPTPVVPPPSMPARDNVLEAQVLNAERQLSQYRADVRRWKQEISTAARGVLDAGSRVELIGFRIEVLGHIANVESAFEADSRAIDEQITKHQEFDTEIDTFRTSRNVRRMLHRLNAQMIAVLKQFRLARREYADFVSQKLLAMVDTKLRELADPTKTPEQVAADLKARYPVVAAYLAR